MKKLTLMVLVAVAGCKVTTGSETGAVEDTTADCTGTAPTVDGDLTGTPGLSMVINGSGLGGTYANVSFPTAAGRVDVVPSLGDEDSIQVDIPAEAVSGDVIITNMQGCAVSAAFTAT